MTRFRIVNDISWNCHRSGWKYVLSLLKPFETGDGILLDGFVDATFGFSEQIFESKNVIPYKESWVGFVHHPPSIPDWVGAHSWSVKNLVAKERFQQSLPYCKGLFTFSKYLSQYLRNRTRVSVRSFHHPTEFPNITFDFSAFEKKRQIVQVGSWLRKLSTFYLIDLPMYNKIQLTGGPTYDVLKSELGNSGRKRANLKDVIFFPFLQDHQYDQLLSESIVFLDLYESSVNNSVIECMARNTPLVVNKIAPVVEYLGPKYPLYYKEYRDIPKILKNTDKIYDAWQYMSVLRSKAKLKDSYFIDSLLSLDVFQ